MSPLTIYVVNQATKTQTPKVKIQNFSVNISHLIAIHPTTAIFVTHTANMSIKIQNVKTKRKPILYKKKKFLKMGIFKK